MTANISSPKIEWRYAYPWEVRPLRCCARRSKRSYITCESMALHDGEHHARGKYGQWFLW